MGAIRPFVAEVGALRFRPTWRLHRFERRLRSMRIPLQARRTPTERWAASFTSGILANETDQPLNKFIRVARTRSQSFLARYIHRGGRAYSVPHAAGAWLEPALEDS